MEKVGLKRQILSVIGSEPVSVAQLYAKFPEQKETTVRGRLYELLGNGVTRVGKGLYISANTISEVGDARKIIDNIVEEGDKFDFIFLDIPYEANGQRGGNRDLFTCDKISPYDFAQLLPKCESLLRTEDSFLCFMFTQGKTSLPAFKRYYKHFENTSLKLAAQGSYEKLWPNGNPMNMGKYKMPLEHIMLFNKSGNFSGYELEQLEFSLSPDFEYPTAKPYEMIKSLVKSFTKPKEWVFDPFVGSAKIVKACKELGRYCHVIDVSETSFNNFVFPLL